MHLARSGGVFIVAEQASLGLAGRAAQSARHHQIVTEAALGRVGQKGVHGSDDLVVLARLKPGQTLHIGGAGFGRADVPGVGGLVFRQLFQRPETMAHRARGQEHHPPIQLFNSAGQALTEFEEIVGVGGLTKADCHPFFITLQIACDVQGAVVDRQTRIVDGGGARAGKIGLRRDQLGQFRIALEVVGHLAHAARQLVRGIEPRAPTVRGDHHFQQGGEMRVEDDDHIRLQHIQHFGAQALQTRDQADVLAFVQFDPVFQR